jgi:hypothetical protein
MHKKSHLYIILSLLICFGCNNNNIKENISIIEENIPKELIKDSSLAQEIYIFVDSLRANGISEDFVLVVKFDSTKFARTGDTVLGIWLDLYPCFSDTTNILGGYLPDLDIPIVIKDEKKIGQIYYNPIILDDNIKQSIYCNESIIETEFHSLYDSLNQKNTIVGLLFILHKEQNELIQEGATYYIENLE